MAQIQVMGFRIASLVRESPFEACVWGLTARWAAPVAVRKKNAQRQSSTTASPTYVDSQTE